MLRLLVLFVMFFVLSACSLQAQKPAPVENINLDFLPNYHKGSIRSDRYKVKVGDTLYSIAWGASKDVNQLAQVNKLDDNYTIYPGQLLLLSRESHKKTIKNKTKIKKAVNNTSGGNKIKNVQVNKKSIENKKSQEYVVTSSKHNINNKASHFNERLPTEVDRWQWPIKGNVIGTFSASGQGNKGIKIAGHRGDKVKAAADGRVVYAGNGLRGYGNLIIIKHNDDYLSAYAHTDKILVKEKQQVSAGQAVATMGSTGINRVMLHFEIRYHGQSVNPLKYLPKR